MLRFPCPLPLSSGPATVCGAIMLLLGLTQLSCRHKNADPVALPNDRVAILEDPGPAGPDAGAKLTEAPPSDTTLLDPRVPILLDQPETPIATLLDQGATRVQIFDVKSYACEALVIEAGSCLDEIEWTLERAEKKLRRVSCRCGVSRQESQILSGAEFQDLESSLRRLTAITAPATCSPEGPEIKVEVTHGPAGDTSSFLVNYGQCGGGGISRRIELKTFESFYAKLNKITFGS